MLPMLEPASIDRHAALVQPCAPAHVGKPQAPPPLRPGPPDGRWTARAQRARTPRVSGSRSRSGRASRASPRGGYASGEAAGTRRGCSTGAPEASSTPARPGESAEARPHAEPSAARLDVPRAKGRCLGGAGRDLRPRRRRRRPPLPAGTTSTAGASARPCDAPPADAPGRGAGGGGGLPAAPVEQLSACRPPTACISAARTMHGAARPLRTWTRRRGASWPAGHGRSPAVQVGWP